VSHWKLTGLVLFLLVAASAFAADENFTVLHGRVVAVGDGDSLTLLVGGQKVKIRLAQIDAPELQQPYGTTSKAALAKMVENQKVRAEVIELDRYGRSVAEVYLDGLHVNREMVELGHAWAYTKYSRSTHIIELEDKARAGRLGLWKLPEEERDAPWEWRHSQRKRSRVKSIDPSEFAGGSDGLSATSDVQAAQRSISSKGLASVPHVG